MNRYTKNNSGACPYCESVTNTFHSDRNPNQKVYQCECAKFYVKTMRGISYPLFDPTDASSEPVTVATDNS